MSIVLTHTQVLDVLLEHADCCPQEILNALSAKMAELPPPDMSTWKIMFGKFKGKTFDEIYAVKESVDASGKKQSSGANYLFEYLLSWADLNDATRERIKIFQAYKEARRTKKRKSSNA